MSAACGQGGGNGLDSSIGPDTSGSDTHPTDAAGTGTQTVGGGAKQDPAQGPAPAYPVAGSNFVLVKNWDFGASGTVRTYADLDQHFQYHDEFGLYNNGNGNYGANTIASSASTAVSGQPIDNANNPVRVFTADSLKTMLVPLDNSGTAVPSQHNIGCGSFVAKWSLPNGGSLLGQDILWETRVRMVTPPYFWFAIWNAGNKWDVGAEMDLVEAFGYDNGSGNTNFDGRYWHSNSVTPYGSDQVNYDNWGSAMNSVGITSFDATQWHTWTLVYKKDNSYAFYVDGKQVQYGSNYNWTLHTNGSGEPINMSFLFDGSWAHTQIPSVNKSLAFSAFAGKYYEWDYSRVYLR